MPTKKTETDETSEEEVVSSEEVDAALEEEDDAEEEETETVAPAEDDEVTDYDVLMDALEEQGFEVLFDRHGNPQIRQAKAPAEPLAKQKQRGRARPPTVKAPKKADDDPAKWTFKDLTVANLR